MEWTDLLILVAAAFSAGIVNTLAGGGTFLTFPALLLTGMPPVTANATSCVAVFPGYLGGALGFRGEIRNFDRAVLIRIIGVMCVGGLAGSILLLVSSNEAFAAIVPFLLLGATLVFAFGEKIRNWASRRAEGHKPYGIAGALLVSTYGGYFNGGLGIMLLALLSYWGMRDLNLMNGLKSALSFILSAVSVVAFSIAGIVAWPQALVMMVAAIAGGYAGAPLARALPAAIVRGIVIGIGLTMSGVFFYRTYIQ